MKRILVVDDEPDILDLVQAVLEGEGYAVDSVGSGRAALERLDDTAYDLIVCDLQMPRLDGAAVYRTLIQRPEPRPAVLFLTGYGAAAAYDAFVRSTGVPVLGKPFDITDLRETVRRLLGTA